jgi:hypothetical protein
MARYPQEQFHQNNMHTGTYEQLSGFRKRTKLCSFWIVDFPLFRLLALF